MNRLRRGVTERSEFLCALKSQQDFTADLVGILQRGQPGSDLFPLVMSKVVVLNAGGKDEEVVREVMLRQVDPARLRIDADHLVQQHLDVALPAQDGPQRPGNLIGGEQAGGDLIQHRAKEMVVAPVDERDADRSASQGTCGIESAETTANNDHARKICGQSCLRTSTL